MASVKMVLCLVSMFVLTTIIAAGPVALNDQEAQKAESCKMLCGHCGCTGFYCGDECICECNNQEGEDLKCVATMQSNCQKMKLPFEVLIQGPSGNRFVRSLLAAETETKTLIPITDVDQRSRSTISIYKPAESRMGFEIVTPAQQQEMESKTMKPTKFDVLLTSNRLFDPESPRKMMESVIATLSNLRSKQPQKREANFDVDMALDSLYKESEVIKRNADEVATGMDDTMVGSVLEESVGASIDSVAAPAPHVASTSPVVGTAAKSGGLFGGLRSRTREPRVGKAPTLAKAPKIAKAPTVAKAPIVGGPKIAAGALAARIAARRAKIGTLIGSRVGAPATE